jgi:hypothetical protein
MRKKPSETLIRSDLGFQAHVFDDDDVVPIKDSS